MKNSSRVTIPLIFLLLGVIVGFLFAPVKNGFGNNAGNRFTLHINHDPEEDV